MPVPITGAHPGAAALRVAEAGGLFRSMFGHSPMGVAVTGRDGTIIAANPALATLAGRPPTILEGMRLGDIVHPDDRIAVTRALRDAAHDGCAPEPFEIRLLPAGAGRPVRALLRPSAVHDAAGDVGTLLVMVEDIADRRAAEEALHHSERRYRHIVEATTEGFWQLDADLVTVEVNDALAHMLGHRVEDILGLPMVDFLTPAGAARLQAELARPDAAERRDIDLDLVGRDGRIANTRVSLGAMEAGDGWFALVTDFTALKRREAALELSEARYRAIVDTAIVAILTVDVRGIVIGANPATERMTGYPADELLGCHVNTLVPEDARERHDTSINRYLAADGPSVAGTGREVTVRRRDGSTFPGWLTLSEINLPGFHVFVSMIRDITTMKAAEAALIEAKEAAELANRAKSAFLSNMSHELRTPLNGILGFADVIHQQMLGALENPMYLNYVAEIKRSGELLLANINDLLEMATIEADKVALEETLIDFRDVVVACLRLVGKRAERARLRIEPDIAAELPPLMADPNALKQVLLHLLSNAIKFTPEGGHIGVSARVDSDGALVAEVFDSGIGIPEDRLETVFQPFVQGDATLSRSYEGIGLGLSIAKSLVEQHGGKLEIRSAAGLGTSVLIHLPKDRFVTDW